MKVSTQIFNTISDLGSCALGNTDSKIKQIGAILFFGTIVPVLITALIGVVMLIGEFFCCKDQEELPPQKPKTQEENVQPQNTSQPAPTIPIIQKPILKKPETLDEVIQEVMNEINSDIDSYNSSQAIIQKEQSEEKRQGLTKEAVAMASPIAKELYNQNMIQEIWVPDGSLHMIITIESFKENFFKWENFLQTEANKSVVNIQDIKCPNIGSNCAIVSFLQAFDGPLFGFLKNRFFEKITDINNSTLKASQERFLFSLWKELLDVKNGKKEGDILLYLNLFRTAIFAFFEKDLISGVKNKVKIAIQEEINKGTFPKEKEAIRGSIKHYFFREVEGKIRQEQDVDKFVELFLKLANYSNVSFGIFENNLEDSITTWAGSVVVDPKNPMPKYLFVSNPNEQNKISEKVDFRPIFNNLSEDINTLYEACGVIKSLNGGGHWTGYRVNDEQDKKWQKLDDYGRVSDISYEEIKDDAQEFQYLVCFRRSDDFTE